jgi:mono/diheme cytochrome c family protein
MQWNKKLSGSQRAAAMQMIVATAALLALAAVLVACAPIVAPTESAAATEPAATEAATEEATEAPAEEATAAPAEEIAMVGDPERGGYIFAITTGCGCHFNRDLAAPAGGAKFEGPFGVVYAPNITSDPETGIGTWSETDIVNALRLGVEPDGGQLHPIMPYMGYSNLSDQDAYDLAAALKMVPPVVNEVPESELAAAPAPFTPASPPPAVAPTEGAERGAYIVAVANCGRCHTPRGENGAPDMARFLAGAPLQDTIAPNLTPHESSNISFLTEEQIAQFLLTGIYDDGTPVEGPMQMIIDNGTSRLTEADALAIAQYLKSLPPVASE